VYPEAWFVLGKRELYAVIRNSDIIRAGGRGLARAVCIIAAARAYGYVHGVRSVWPREEGGALGVSWVVEELFGTVSFSSAF